MFDFFSYSTADDSILTKAFHLPNISASLLSRYKINDKIFTGLELFYVGKRYGRILPNQKINSTNNLVKDSKKRTLDGYFDINLSGQYQFSKNFGVTLDLKNLLNTKYEVWNYYQVRGTQVMFGLKYRFL
jgi:outer membrane receptor protein involved in Fe transport